MNQKDLRVIKSKNSIKNAFLELMAEKGYQNITVTDIAKKAVINRKTFYFHYETKKALYDEIADEVTNIIKPEEILFNIQTSSKEGQLKIIYLFLMELKAHKKECIVFLDDKSNPGFSNKLKQKLSDALLSKTEITKRTKGTKYTFEFLLDAYFAVFQVVLRTWLNSENDDPEFAISYLFEFFSQEALELLGIKYN